MHDQKKPGGRDSSGPITSNINPNYADQSVDNERLELIQTGLTCLQKDHNNAILTFNTAYLALLIDSFKKCQKNSPLPHLMLAHIDDEVRSLFERVLTELARLTKLQKMT